jgi:transketolase
VRNTFADTFYELGKEHDDLAVVVADISPAGSMGKFREDFPNRFINTGVAEQVMIGLCAGMALNGMRPFAYTIATFTLFRTFEFVRDDLCYQGLPVTVVGIGGGVTYSTLGGTHHAMEDVAIASAIPGMQVIAPCDPAETREITVHLALNNDAPAYLRLGKAGEPDLTSDAVDPFRFGKLRYLRRGSDTCVLSYGPTVATAVAVAERLEARGESVSVASVHAIKPLDVEGVAGALRDHARVVVIEEMVPHGGLSSRVKEVAVDSGSTRNVTAFTLQDKFIHVYGSHPELLAAHGLDADSIASRL